MAEASYHVVTDPAAQRELDALAREFDTDGLRERIFEAATHRQPKTHPSVEALAGYPHLLKVRGDGIRAICELDKPEFRVLLVDKRRVVYDRLDVADARAGGEA